MVTGKPKRISQHAKTEAEAKPDGREEQRNTQSECYVRGVAGPVDGALHEEHHQTVNTHEL